MLQISFLAGILVGVCITLAAVILVWIIRHYPVDTINTTMGLNIKLSPLSSFIHKQDFDQWIWEVCDLWTREKGYSITSVISSIRGTTIVIIDQSTIPIDYGQNPARSVLGVAYHHSKTLYICSLYLGNDKKSIRKQIEYLFKHEVSHIISGYVGNMWSEEESHPIFRELGLKYAEEQKSEGSDRNN